MANSLLSSQIYHITTKRKTVKTGKTPLFSSRRRRRSSQSHELFTEKLINENVYSPQN